MKNEYSLMKMGNRFGGKIISYNYSFGNYQMNKVCNGE